MNFGIHQTLVRCHIEAHKQSVTLPPGLPEDTSCSTCFPLFEISCSKQFDNFWSWYTSTYPALFYSGKTF